MATFLERYLDGECEQVWDELIALGSDVRQAHIIDDALGVARETMRRAVKNIQTLIERLNGLGYEFGYPTEGWLRPQMPYLSPTENAPTRLHELQQLAGPLPLSLQAWYEIGGEVHFVGKAPWRNSDTFPDALVVDSVDTAIEGIREWLEGWADTPAEERPTDEPCIAWIAPDEYHKDDISGGAPYGIALPALAADALIENEWHHTTFVSYLRTCFACGGFPGLARESGGLPEVERELARDLIPL